MMNMMSSMVKNIVLLFGLMSCFLGQSQPVTYQESVEDFSNPDRGFYTPLNGVASNFTPLTVNHLVSLSTTSFTPWQGNYKVKTNVIFRHYILDSYVNTDVLPTTFLTKIQTDFNVARQAGVRLLIRFSYTITAPSGNCGSWICAPYGDAPKSRVLEHIALLKPYLQANEDVILAVQNGFIGVWGEQYYSDYFGDASVQGKLTNQNWQDRIDVLRALLDAVPRSRMVQVRYPQVKQKYVYGISATVNSDPMALSKAFDASDIARIGFHNDCFFSASDDQGTYWDYGTSTSSASNQTTVLKSYQSRDSKYTLVGGETCADQYNPQNNCESEGGRIVTDMDDLNLTYLNSDYNNDVNNDWQTGGCMSAITRNLGYRFVMKSGEYSTVTTVGGNVDFNLTLENSGFTSPVNKRNTELVLRNESTKVEFRIALTGVNADSRFWFPGVLITLNQYIKLPSTIPNGKYKLFLHLSDSSNNGSILHRPEYSIRMANTNTWEATTGYNDLKHLISIDNVLGASDVLLDKIAVYPNPASSIFNIENHKGEEWKVLDVVGDVVMQGHSSEVNLSGYSKGVYILTVREKSVRLLKVD